MKNDDCFDVGMKICDLRLESGSICIVACVGNWFVFLPLFKGKLCRLAACFAFIL